jgi:hypothetical protein
MSLCEECKAPAVVGWGNPPVWLCQEHFEEELAKRRCLIDQAVTWPQREARTILEDVPEP